ncbi:MULTISPECIES: hypothetical protein [Streptomyces]|uniref:Uncharacterized protein n=1 Tax=Streptomyces glycanivorans TaxID=3033808 RepID=A0ABY9JN52_9ACTN|nr:MULTISPECIES: hypothetical protein [unclassified Streptomyces]WSQ81779.1 hypothetical protein OG725_33825 [Streptomyces sp. NBC_01213]TXS15911.1 hypothetical protein EAO68_16350 [Streptomyces sp. wa22]WLQ68419.1 hypothetical protein P8A20_34825 [Streptomyces sp. Alt3]WSQ89105.1 hypothetical protein OG722_34225 [Streptomyces sp. NBC_01212]WSR04889.1 hypothetical protein OG265_02275 [Streptomyces sp. NBC_01208]
MTDHTERTTKHVLDTGSRQGAPATGTPERAPVTTPGRTPETAAADAPGDRKGLDQKLGGPDGLGVPPAPRTAPTAAHTERTGRQEAVGTGSPLVPRGDQDKLSQRMQHAVTDFVESPRRAVEEAESTFDQIVAGLTEALTERKRVLRASWQEQDTEAQTEELRVALQHYRDLSEQLLKI